MNRLFPVGSVIEIKNNKYKYVIIGCMKNDEKSNYDYICVMYPHGFLDIGDFFYINEEDVSFVFFFGDINY